MKFLNESNEPINETIIALITNILIVTFIVFGLWVGINPAWMATILISTFIVFGLWVGIGLLIAFKDNKPNTKER